MSYHEPVLLHKSVEALQVIPNGIYVDATYGGGGHTREILSKLGADGKIFGFDQDPDVRANILQDSRFVFTPCNFKYIKNYLKLYKALPIDGLIADLGVSSHQFDQPSRGFSIRFDSALDMRMDPELKNSAEWLINNLEEKDLKRIFRVYGDLPEAGRLANLIFKKRSEKPIKTTSALIDLIRPLAKRKKENQFFAQVFQALRIEVNDEVESLKSMLFQCAEIIKPGGRMVILSYHSIEDRLVKNFIRSGKFEGEADKDLFGNVNVPFTAVNRSPIRPSESEIEKNSRARSALLRIAQKN